MELVIIGSLAVAGLYFLRKKEKPSPLDVCIKCGGKTEHICGMGACVDWCPKCHEL